MGKKVEFPTCPPGGHMKLLNLLLWVGQFGFSILFPTLFFLLLAQYLRQRFQIGIWVVIVLGIVGVLTSITTARSCLRAMLKAAREASDRDDSPTAFNDHR